MNIVIRWVWQFKTIILTVRRLKQKDSRMSWRLTCADLVSYKTQK